MTLSCALLIFAAGCSDQVPPLTSEAAADDLINTVCPIMGGEATADVSVDWNGKKVGFCCPPCIEEWEELTDQERESKLASATRTSHGGEHDHSHDDHTH